MTISTTIRRGVSTLALSALAAGALAPAGDAHATPRARPVRHSRTVPTRVVQVRDDYFAPDQLTVKEGTRIKWVWMMSNYDTHNVTLQNGPKGVSKRDFTSIDGTSGVVFTRSMTVPGRYDFYCTIHPETMTMTVIVKR